MGFEDAVPAVDVADQEAEAMRFGKALTPLRAPKRPPAPATLGPLAPPLVPGHLGYPDKETCRAALAVLGACELLGDDELMRLAENRLRDLGVSPEQLREWTPIAGERTTGA